MSARSLAVAGVASLLVAVSGVAQDARDQVARHVAERGAEYAALAQRIWDLAEVGYLEHESSGLLQARLAEAGFTVTPGVASIPTAFVASYRSGDGPVVAILAEFDALPGIKQDRVPERSPIADKPAGHPCGHHLFGTGSTAAALAVRDWLATSGTPGEIRLYGTPAESIPKLVETRVTSSSQAAA